MCPGPRCTGLFFNFNRGSMSVRVGCARGAVPSGREFMMFIKRTLAVLSFVAAFVAMAAPPALPFNGAAQANVLAKLPISFEENAGQTDHRARERACARLGSRHRRRRLSFHRVFDIPISSFTSRIVSRAIARARAAPSPSISASSSARPRTSIARSRIGPSSASIDSNKTFLQSMHPQPAVLH